MEWRCWQRGRLRPFVGCRGDRRVAWVVRVLVRVFVFGGASDFGKEGGHVVCLGSCSLTGVDSGPKWKLLSERVDKIASCLQARNHSHL
jgi:hypothetical protein